MRIKRLDDGDFLITVQCDLRTLTERKMFVAINPDGSPKHPEMVPIIVKLGRAYKLLDGILSGTYESAKDAGSSIKLSRSSGSRILRMSFLSPYIVEQIVSGKLNIPNLLSKMDALIALPLWHDQHKLLGLED